MTAPSGGAGSLSGDPPSSREVTPPAAQVRLFVALELPPAARAALVAFREAVADPRVWRPVPDEAVHLTLAFLGRRPAADVEAISAVLREAGGPPPRLLLASALLLPPRRARVLAVALTDPDGTLAALQGHVSAQLEAAGVFVPEKRPFRAHATVARLRPRERAPRSLPAEPEPLEFHADTLTLFESRLHPRGARYEALSRVTLH
jgi:RNA 2',3'-cyclic 3'-phosphodiesterase